MKTLYFEEISQLIALKETASKQLSKARQMHEKANNIHWSLSDVEEKSERHNAYIESQNLFVKSRDISELYTMVSSACDDAIMRIASNALIEDMKANSEIWCKTPIHYKRFNDMIDAFFEPYHKTYSNGATSNFKVTKDYYRIELCAYHLCEHNRNTRQLVYANTQNERLTIEDIEKMDICEYIAPADIVKTCKKALKDIEKMKKEYEKAYKTISNIKSAYSANGAIYYSMPSLPSYMNK